MLLPFKAPKEWPLRASLMALWGGRATCPASFCFVKKWKKSGPGYCSFSYSALACFRMGMSGSASFQKVRHSESSGILRFGLLQEHDIGIRMAAQDAKTLPIW